MDRQQDKEYYFGQGLPNLGNTCYLNSIIQFLYSSEKLRQLMSQIMNKSQKQTLKSLIANLFHQITMKSKLKQRQISLRKIIKKIKMIDKQIKCHNQQDFFQILLLVLNQLFQEDREIQKLFQIQTYNKCQCGNYIISTIFLTDSGPICQICQKNIELKLIKSSQLLIISNQHQQNSLFPQGKYYKEYNNGGLLYKCIAKIFYLGNSEVGHYKVSRICFENLFVEFSDRQSSFQFGRNPLYLLYEKVDQHILLVNQDSKIQPYKIYRSKVKLLEKILQNHAFLSEKLIYFMFKEGKQDASSIRMHVLNQDNFIVSVSNIIKKTNDSPLISTFLYQFQQQMNKKITKFYNQTKNLKEINRIQEKDQFKNSSYIEVRRK